MVRTLVDGQPVEKPPKTAAGRRTLPLDDALVSALRAFRAVQATERLAAGEAYAAAADYVASWARRWTRPGCGGCGTG